MIDDLLKGLLAVKGQGWITMLTSKFGFDAEQASAFVPAALSKVGSLISSGKLDLAGGFNAGSILSMLNAGEIGEAAGVDSEKAAKGLKALIPEVLSSAEEKAGGADGILSMLTKDGIGASLGKIGTLF